MSVPWGKIAAFGSLLTFIAVAPFLFGMVNITFGMSLQNTDTSIVADLVSLFAGAVKEMAPLTIGGVCVFMFFQFAEAQA